jgi:hypothetical protein
MSRKDLIASLLICVGATLSCCLAEDDVAVLRDIDKYTTKYYANPKPHQAPELLTRYLRCQFFTDEEKTSVLLNERLSYFFARVAQQEPNILEDYLNILEEGNHRQREFMVDVLALGGNSEVAEYLESKLRAGRFGNEAEQIRWYLDEGIPYDFDVLEQDVNHPADIEYLLAEFMATGQDKAILKIIDFLAEPNNIEAEPNDVTAFVEYGKRTLVRYGKKDEKILTICRKQLGTSSGAKRGVLEEIIDGIDGSISIPRLVEQLKDEKPVTGAKAWALGASAVLIERNHGRHNFLSPDPINERNIRAERKLLEEWWGVESRQELYETLDSLLSKGHRSSFEQQGQYLQNLSQEQYDETLKQYQGDNEKLQEIRIAKEYYAKLGQKSLLGWDLSRYICLCRWGYLSGYISEEEAWKKIMPVSRKLQETFDSWEDLGQNYLIGRQFWSYKYTRQGGDRFEDAYQRLVDMKSSPWNLYSWNLDLTDRNEKPDPNEPAAPVEPNQQEQKK